MIGTHLDRVVAISNVVWESVLSWVLPTPTCSKPTPLSTATWTEEDEVLTPAYCVMPREHAVDMCRIAEAMFPLVGRVCGALLRHYRKSYVVLKISAEAGSRRCIDWVLRHRRRNESNSGNYGRKEKVKRNKEFKHVLSWLCAGGHLGMARLLVDGKWPGLVWDCGNC
ncbi:hypothetical protein Pelo_12749 [Pelomyxa schiedti]|nr:hypothetical protein Pelo_12749 [Pelomyxa schiedti]